MVVFSDLIQTRIRESDIEAPTIIAHVMTFLILKLKFVKKRVV